MEEHALGGGEELDRFLRPERVRMSGQAPEISTEVLLRQGEELVYEVYRTKSQPGACRMALRDFPGGEVLQVRRLVALPDDPEAEVQARAEAA